MTGILQGVRILDFGRYIAAPWCCQVLADMGADVIRVDRPGGEADRERAPLGPDGRSLYFTCINRNKRAITLNLTVPEGQALLHRLVGESDVVVHNLPGTRAERLGLDYPTLSAVNPRLVYLGVSGFGAEGPYRERVAFDGVAQAMSGAMSMTGDPSAGPTLSHIPWVDFGTALYGASGVAAALFARHRTGRGQQVDLALYGTAVSLVAGYAAVAEYEATGTPRAAIGNDWIYGVGGRFSTRDGAIVINVFSDPMWRQLCDVIGRPDMKDAPGLTDDVSRFEHRETINEAISAWCAPLTRTHAIEALGSSGIAAGPVQTVGDLLEDPGVAALNGLQSIEQPGIGEVTVPTSPLKFGGRTLPIARPAPGIGEHNAEVYGALGLSADEVEALATAGVI